MPAAKPVNILSQSYSLTSKHFIPKKEPHGKSHIPPTWAYPQEENPESL
jgi:hypothetical protein